MDAATQTNELPEYLIPLWKTHKSSKNLEVEKNHCNNSVNKNDNKSKQANIKLKPLDESEIKKKMDYYNSYDFRHCRYLRNKIKLPINESVESVF